MTASIRSRFKWSVFFFFQAEDGIRDLTVTGVQTCALPIWASCSIARRKDCWITGGSAAPCITAQLLRARPRGSNRSEERRVGEEWRSRWSADHLKKKKK